MTELSTPIGRLVAGHPIKSKPSFDDKTKQPRLDSTGRQMNETFIALAIPKIAGLDWKQTDWGQILVGVAQGAFVAGESGRNDFAWKVTDGDSTVVNQKSVRWCDKEGYPGHWVMNLSTMYNVTCYHTGRYAPHDAIKDAAAIKAGDYIRVNLEIKGNGSQQSPGIYLNPVLVSVEREGVEIIPVGKDAGAAFGAPQQQQQAPPPQQQQQQAPPPQQTPDLAPPPPADDFVKGPVMYNANGKQCTKEALLAAGWNEAQVDALPH